VGHIADRNTRVFLPLFLDAIFTARTCALFDWLPGMLAGAWTNPACEIMLGFPMTMLPFAVNREYESLSSREQEVLRMIAEGIPARDIEERLFISVKTVENHRANILHKLRLRTTVELVKYASRIGLIDVDTWKG